MVVGFWMGVLEFCQAVLVDSGITQIAQNGLDVFEGVGVVVVDGGDPFAQVF